MGKEKVITSIILTATIIIALTHSTFHFAAFGSGVLGLKQSSLVSGFSIGDTDIGEELEAQKAQLSPLSIIILTGEWVLVGLLFALGALRKKIELKEEISSIHIKHISDKSKTKTELDSLYKILQEKKRLNLATISKAFKVDKKIALEWCKTLESGDLAIIYTPRFGDPVISIRD